LKDPSIDAFSQYSKRHARSKMVILILLLLLMLVTFGSITIGYAEISFPKIMKIFLGEIPFIKSLFRFEVVSPNERLIIMDLRLPRVLGGILVGAALSTAGVVFQGVFRNPLADPYIIGISSGAALGAALAIVLHLGFLLHSNEVHILRFP